MKKPSIKQVPGNSNTSTGVLICLGLFLVCLYAWTSPPGTTPEDASEFILTAHFLGIPHPPGYPLFVWLGHFCSYLPWGSPAQKIAFLSHLSMAGSAVIWGFWVFSLFNNILLASWITLTFGLSLPVWSSGQLVEVYPLHTFLLTLIFFLAFQINRAKENNLPTPLLFLFGLTSGFGIANHYPLVVLAFPAIITLLYPAKAKMVSWLQIRWVVLGLILGLVPYLYLFVAHLFSDFIFSYPITNLSKFMEYVSRKEYATNDRSRVFSLLTFGQYAWLALKQAFWSFTPIVFLGAIFGSRKFFQKSKSSNLPLALILGSLSSFVFLFLFWQPDYYRLAIELFETFHGFALGCFIFFATCCFWFSLKDKKRARIALLLLWFVPALLFLFNFRPLDRRTDTFTKDYAALVLDAIPENALLFVKGDTDAGILAYYHFLENQRPDIKLISQVAALLPEKPFDRATDIPTHQHQVALLNLISAQLSAKRPVFSIGPIEYFSPDSSPFPLKTKNYGLFREIYEEEPAPERDFSQLVPLEISFLDKSLNTSFDPNFKHYRDRVVSDVCHSLLISRTSHRAFDVIPRCQLLKAQWMHVEKQDYSSADKLFISAIEGSRLTQNSELAEMAKDFVLNRMKILETTPAMSEASKRAFLEEMFRITLPIALDFKTCKNNLAPKLFKIASANHFEREANTIRNAFLDCGF